ncbi:MAG: sulfite exporter TauE/SafE family protein [Thermus sp.]|uniref:sulfite exporter TauE/SafE family protein n=1 Tax=unclassified Thermus TaxID=2619321 RepID=UPI00023892E0|nr:MULTISPECIES: sulfite exporter TauE/SafE family protein [unclassified Thermus]AEV16602.1 permease [Thermus sp. CCB_US3_UF1]MCS6869790.1 sulfite exporter TauE/SafE family protein [Thermus sp.]MCS7217704.1 sulfite exporter TauE/SafE family protein [Thermus sp.]MCX7849158.1 sulfite exporter TauE/SafE family protein [Thermus sp.]MDW8016224.1 sulfite exporter TauE/SafE family protein [Thermus sp.]
MTLALFGALLIGLSLGLLGSGGSILTVPVLVYLLGEAPKQAIAESLLIVGGIALLGALPYALRGLVDGRNVLFFGLPGMAGTYLGAWLSRFVSGEVQLLVFALVMLLAAYFMARPAPLGAPKGERKAWKILLDGLAVGALTGFVGVGGGFLIVPALVLLGGLPMHLAVGTSLVIIALKSFAGFYKYLHLLPAYGLSVNYAVAGLFILVGTLGSLLGGRLAVRLPQEGLKRGFALFLVLMGVLIVAQSLSG